MCREDFLQEMQEILQTEEELFLEFDLESYEEWDSLSKMATLAFLDANFSIKLTLADFENIKTIKDIADLCGVK